MKVYDSTDAAEADNVPPEEQMVVGWRTKQERDAILLALQHGNRKQRRDRKYRAHLLPKEETGAEVPDISPQERRKRAAARVAAKKQRKRNT